MYIYIWIPIILNQVVTSVDCVSHQTSSLTGKSQLARGQGQRKVQWKQPKLYLCTTRKSMWEWSY